MIKILNFNIDKHELIPHILNTNEFFFYSDKYNFCHSYRCCIKEENQRVTSYQFGFQLRHSSEQVFVDWTFLYYIF